MGLVRKDEFFTRVPPAMESGYLCGAKSGLDGSHGATMASEEFSQASEAKRPNVQVGDPFLEKLLLEPCWKRCRRERLSAARTWARRD